MGRLPPWDRLFASLGRACWRGVCLLARNYVSTASSMGTSVYDCERLCRSLCHRQVHAYLYARVSRLYAPALQATWERSAFVSALCAREKSRRAVTLSHVVWI